MHKLHAPDLYMTDDLYRFLVSKIGHIKVANYLMDSYVTSDLVNPLAINYLDVHEGGDISFVPKGKMPTEPVTTDHQLRALPARQRMSPGKAIRKLFSPVAFRREHFALSKKTWTGEPCLIPPLSDADIEQFVVAIQSQFQPLRVILVTGEAIRYFYHELNYTRAEKSTLHSSCMRYLANAHQTRNYARNPRTIGMLVALDTEGKAKGRALLWKSPMGFFMDRVYGTDQTRNGMRRLASERGWMVRDTDSAGTNRILVNSRRSLSHYIVPLQQWGVDVRPYMDSMHHFAVHRSGHVSREYMDPQYANELTNPTEYHFCCFQSLAECPADGSPIFRARSRSAQPNKQQLDARVDWLSNFDDLPPWPDDLLTSNPAWTLGEDPEDDEANWNVLPVRRTEAWVYRRPTPSPSSWTSTVASAGRAESAMLDFNVNMEALTNAFAQVAGVAEAVQAATQNPAIQHLQQTRQLLHDVVEAPF